MPIYKEKGSKDGKQRYRVQINYKDIYGKHRQTSRITYGLQEAKTLEHLLTRELKSRPVEARITLNDLCEEYYDMHKHCAKESTVEKESMWLRNHVLPDLGSLYISDLTIPILQKWKNNLESKEQCKKSKVPKKLSLKTKQNIYGALRSVLNFAVKMEYVNNNALVKIGNFKDVESVKKEMLYYTADEFKRFAAVAREKAVETNVVMDWDYYVFFAIAFFTGLRKGEIHALKWSDIEGEYLTVSRSITQKLKGGDKETRPKTASSIRTLQIPIPLQNILAEHKLLRKDYKGFSDDFRVCGGEKPLRDTSIQKRNKQYAEAAGLKVIRIHDFRHSHVSLLANSGINIQEIARRLGHSNVEETWNTYSHLYPREEERAVNVLNSVKLDI